MNSLKTILVIEDDWAIRQLYREAFEMEGYRVLCAENGADGFEVIKNSSGISLIVLDMMMPVMGGREFLDIYSRSGTSRVPVIVVAADANEENSKGAKSFLRKPIDIDDLLKVVKESASL